MCEFGCEYQADSQILKNISLLPLLPEFSISLNKSARNQGCRKSRLRLRRGTDKNFSGGEHFCAPISPYLMKALIPNNLAPLRKLTVWEINGCVCCGLGVQVNNR
jgi:hypothetical protein